MTTRTRQGLALTLMLFLGCVGCGKEGAEEAPKEAEVKPIAVSTQIIEPQTFTQTFTFPGTAQPIEERQIAAESAGRVLAAPFEESEMVKKGDLLLRVNASTSNAQASLIESQIKSSQRELSRTRLLAKEGLATPQQVDQLEAQVDQAKLSLNQVKVSRGLSTVKSPFDGKVARKYLDVGEFASPGQPLVDLVDLSTIKLEITVPESAIGYIDLGDVVTVRFPSTGKSVKGTVAKRGVVVQQPTQTFPVEVHIPNEDEAILAGMRAEVIVPKLTLKEAVVIPRDALLEGVLRKEAVVAVTKDGAKVAEVREVEMGEARANEVVIDSGLKPGEELVVTGHRNVVNGTRLRVVNPPGQALQKKSAPEETLKEKAVPVVAPGAEEKEGSK